LKRSQAGEVLHQFSAACRAAGAHPVDQQLDGRERQITHIDAFGCLGGNMMRPLVVFGALQGCNQG
jgi:hypothetical protein